MTEVPKIVHHRLQAAGRAAEGAHPEADVLAAFAEKSLSEREREGLLKHLAECTDCRDVVVLALPATEAATAPIEHGAEALKVRVPVARWNWFSWGNLRWAALAAGIAVAVLVARPGVERWAKSTPPTSAVVSKTSPAVAPPAPLDQIAMAPAIKRDMAVKAESAPAKRELFSNQPREGFSPAPAGGTEKKALVAGVLRKDAAAAVKQAPASPPLALAHNAPASANETLEVSGVAIATPALSDKESTVARLEPPPIEKAKPALDEATKDQKTAVAGARVQVSSGAGMGGGVGSAARAAAPMMKAAGPTALWTIKSGILERSHDGGQSWQDAAPTDHTLLCYANRGQEVWAGGEAGTLLHSSDLGTTWSTVKPSFQGQSLDADVIAIQVRADTAEVTLTTASHETWTTADGGKTWMRK